MIDSHKVFRIWQRKGKPRSSGRGNVYTYKSFNGDSYGRDEMYNILRAWRQTHQLDISMTLGGGAMSASSPMIMEVLIPLQRANTRDPEIRNPALKGGEGVIMVLWIQKS